MREKRSAVCRERQRERERVCAQLEKISKRSHAPRKREESSDDETVHGANCEPTALAMNARRSGRRERERERVREIGSEGERKRVAGYVNSRQHVQPRKSDLGGQCSPCKQAIVVRRRESIGSPLSLG